ncbi:SIMPL domain-containing protein [Bacteroidia bacterium]|nr:SIMPL domain-containing protein [Bacteroidia bacterium]
MKKNIQIAILGASVALGLIVLGICINKGLQSFSNKERVVTVKGLAEKEIKASSAVVRIDYSFSGDETKPLVENIDKRTAAISAYLKSKGYKDVAISALNLFDSKTYYETDWVDGKRVQIKKDRYRASKYQTLTVNEVVEEAEEICNQINIDLINKDITADVSTIYKFPELNSIKPALIAESTKNARTAGEQFAEDSHSRLGKIKTASQGQISLVGRYDEDGLTPPPAPYFQKARVVSSIVFFLED